MRIAGRITDGFVQLAYNYWLTGLILVNVLA